MKDIQKLSNHQQKGETQSMSLQVAPIGGGKIDNLGTFVTQSDWDTFYEAMKPDYYDFYFIRVEWYPYSSSNSSHRIYFSPPFTPDALQMLVDHPDTYQLQFTFGDSNNTTYLAKSSANQLILTSSIYNSQSPRRIPYFYGVKL